VLIVVDTYKYWDVDSCEVVLRVISEHIQRCINGLVGGGYVVKQDDTLTFRKWFLLDEVRIEFTFTGCDKHIRDKFQVNCFTGPDANF